MAHLTAYLKRIDELSSKTQRISFKQFATFNRVMTHLDEVPSVLVASRAPLAADRPQVHTAMNLASRNGCTREEFKRAALIGTGEKLDDTTVDVVFALFDKNKDGRLDPSEFYEILHSRQTRGLHSARDTGIVGFACVLCASVAPSSARSNAPRPAASARRTASTSISSARKCNISSPPSSASARVVYVRTPNAPRKAFGSGRWCWAGG